MVASECKYEVRSSSHYSLTEYIGAFYETVLRFTNMENSNREQHNNYGKRPLWQWVAIYVVIALVIYGGLYYFFLNKNGTYNANLSASNMPTNAPIPTGAPQTGAVQMAVTGTDFAFNPSTITVSAGQSVQLTFKNKGQYSHNLTIPDLNAQTKTIQPGQQAIITFTPTRAGSFEYLCTVPGHADRGMIGTIMVR